MIAEVAQYQFTVQDYHRMGETGIITEETRVELIHGQIYTMSPVGRRHSACVKRINKFFAKKIDEQAIISVSGSDSTERFFGTRTGTSLYLPIVMIVTKSRCLRLLMCYC